MENKNINLAIPVVDPPVAHDIWQAEPPWFRAAVQAAVRSVLESTLVPDIARLDARLDANEVRHRNTVLSRVGMNIVELPKFSPGFGEGNPPEDFIGNLNDIRVGMTPTQAGLPNLFPTSMVAINDLSHEQVDQLTWFYNEPFAPGEFLATRCEAVRRLFTINGW